MIINKYYDNDTLTIKLEGKIDSNNYKELEKEINNLDNVKKLIIDLENVNYIVSAGISLLLVFNNIMSKKGEIIILNPNPFIQDLFESLNITDIINVKNTNGLQKVK